jgi:hypothetical protein
MDIFKKIQELVESSGLNVTIEPEEDGVILKTPTNINPPLKITPKSDGYFWVRDVQDGPIKQVYGNLGVGSEYCDQSKVLNRVRNWLGGLR